MKILEFTWQVGFFVTRRDDDGDCGRYLLTADRKASQARVEREQNRIAQVNISYQRERDPEEEFLMQM